MSKTFIVSDLDNLNEEQLKLFSKTIKNRILIVGGNKIDSLIKNTYPDVTSVFLANIGFNGKYANEINDREILNKSSDGIFICNEITFRTRKFLKQCLLRKKPFKVFDSSFTEIPKEVLFSIDPELRKYDLPNYYKGNIVDFKMYDSKNSRVKEGHNMLIINLETKKEIYKNEFQTIDKSFIINVNELKELDNNINYSNLFEFNSFNNTSYSDEINLVDFRFKIKISEVTPFEKSFELHNHNRYETLEKEFEYKDTYTQIKNYSIKLFDLEAKEVYKNLIDLQKSNKHIDIVVKGVEKINTFNGKDYLEISSPTIYPSHNIYKELYIISKKTTEDKIELKFSDPIVSDKSLDIYSSINSLDKNYMLLKNSKIGDLIKCKGTLATSKTKAFLQLENFSEVKKRITKPVSNSQSL